MTVGKPASNEAKTSQEGSKSSNTQLPTPSTNAHSETGEETSEVNQDDNPDKPAGDSETKQSDNVKPQDHVKPNATIADERNCTFGNSSNSCEPEAPQGYYGQLKDMLSNNKGMVQRTFYVLIGVTGLVITYFVVKTYR